LETNYFTILYWFCHTLTWISHGYTCVPHPEPPSHLPPHPIPLGHPSAPAPSTLYERQQKRHRCIEQSFGLCGRGRGWDDLALKHVYYHMWNESPVQVRCMIQGARGWCTRMTLGMGWGERWEGGSGWGTHVHPWLIHVNVWQNQYNIVK